MGVTSLKTKHEYHNPTDKIINTVNLWARSGVFVCLFVGMFYIFSKSQLIFMLNLCMTQVDHLHKILTYGADLYEAIASS